MRVPGVQVAAKQAVWQIVAALHLTLAKARIIERLDVLHDGLQRRHIRRYGLFFYLPQAGHGAKAQVFLPGYRNHGHFWQLQEQRIRLAFLRFRQRIPDAMQYDMAVVAHQLRLLSAGALC